MGKVFRSMHITEMQQLLDIACERKQTVNLLVWEGSTGNIIEYKGWLVSSSNWVKGWHRIINPVNNQFRTVPDIFIFNINGHPIHL